jgi:RNA polymerase sigma-70 factor, ECF subfamily
MELLRSRRRLRSVPDPVGGEPGPADPLGLLMARAGQGDEAAFAELYDGLAATVYGIVLRVLRDPGHAEEVAQEVFVEVWRLAPRYRTERGSVRAWVATIAHRRAVDRVRSEQASRDRQARAERQEIDVGEDVGVVVTERLERERVRRALELLAPVQRQAVELAYYGGHTYREVATLLGTPEGTVKTRIRDGLIHLRDHMGGAV